MVLISGGVKSGKSSYALHLAKEYPGPRAFVATAEPFDAEMKVRIEKHQKNRGDEYELFEEPLHLGRILPGLTHNVIVVDCLTMWLANLYQYELDVNGKITELLTGVTGKEIFVSNEVGWGIIPERALTREYLENLSRINRELAQRADKVYLMVVGIPVAIKK